MSAFDQRGQTVGQQTQGGAEAFVRGLTDRIADLERRLAALEQPRPGPKGRQVPSIGRVVHYWPTPTMGPYAALVTAVQTEGDPDSALHLTWWQHGGDGNAVHFVPPRHQRNWGWEWPPFVPPAQATKEVEG